MGLLIFCLPLISAMLEHYVAQFLPRLRADLWELQPFGGLMLIASSFMLDRDFWSKVRALFCSSARFRWQAGDSARAIELRVRHPYCTSTVARSRWLGYVR